MQTSFITFQFPDYKSAIMALDTLEELGYNSDYHEKGHKQVIHIHIERNDLTSALEIAQAYGGTLLESTSDQDHTVMQTAYSLDSILIPAHTVNEDWTEAYAHGHEDGVMDGLLAEATEEQAYNHFSADIHA